MQLLMPLMMPERRWNVYHLHQTMSVKVMVWVMMDPSCILGHSHGHETSCQCSLAFSSA